MGPVLEEDVGPPFEAASSRAAAAADPSPGCVAIAVVVVVMVMVVVATVPTTAPSCPGGWVEPDMVGVSIVVVVAITLGVVEMVEVVEVEMVMVKVAVVAVDVTKRVVTVVVVEAVSSQYVPRAFGTVPATHSHTPARMDVAPTSSILAPHVGCCPRQMVCWW
jgi:hypothetical protein